MRRKPRILLVDDDEGFRSIVARSMREHFIVLPAADGEEALARARELRPDVILLDMLMPGWDGLRTLQELRAIPELRDIPVMALTADNRRGTVQSVIAAGADGYTLKETFHDSPSTLLKRIRNLVTDPQPRWSS